MKYTTLVLGIIAAGCGAASIYLGARLSSTQAELAQQVQGRSEDQARIRELEAGQRRYEAASNTIAQQPPAKADVPRSPAPSTAQRLGDTSIPGGNLRAGPRFDRSNNTATSAAERSNRRMQQEIRLRRTFADMPETLGLDAAQADKLFNLLADSRISAADEARVYQGDPIARESLEAAAREQRDAEIEALLGPDKAAEFHQFEKSIPARMQVNQIGENMAAANVPLSNAQRNSLIAAVYTEQQARPMPERIPNPTPEYESNFIEWQMEYSKRVQAKVEPLLTAEQAARYRESVELQNARRAERRARIETRRNDGRQ